MPEIPFIGGSYKGRSTNLNAQVSQNLYPVMSKDGKAVKALYAVPGMIDWTFKVGSEPFGPGKDLFSGAVSSIYSAYDLNILRVDTVDSFPWNFNGNVSINGTGFNSIPNDITKILFGSETQWTSLVSKTNTKIVVHADVVHPHSSELRLIDNLSIAHDFPAVGWGNPGLYTVEGWVFESLTPNRWSKNMGVDGSTSIVITGRNFSTFLNNSQSALYLVDSELITFHYHPASLTITPTTISVPFPAGVRTHYNLSEGDVIYAVYFYYQHPTKSSINWYSNTLNVPAADSTITLVTPSTGIQGNTVTLTGTDFPPDPTWIVNFGSSVATENTRISSTQWTCKVPVPPVSAPCDVNVSFGTAHSTLVNGFHYSA